MSSLHTISKAPSSNLLDSCIALLKPGDAVLFLEDGIYYSMQSQLLDCIGGDISLYCQREDLVARGFLDQVQSPIETVSYAKFVDLCVKHEKIVSWF